MILSPIASGNGAYVVHKSIERRISNYRVIPYNPYLTLFPPFLTFLLNNVKAKLIHTTPDYGCFFHKSNVPLVLTFHGFVLDKFMKRYSSLAQYLHYRTDLRYFTLKSINRAAIVTAVSKFTAALVSSELNLTREIRVIYNGIDTERFCPEIKSDKNIIKVLFVGNLRKAKGVSMLPLIADKLSDGIVIEYTTGLRNLNKNFSSPKLINIGSVPYVEMPQLYNQADILLFPTAREGLPLAVAEAMSSGLPVVATNCSSLPELVVDGKGGYLCEPGNVSEFAERINALAESARSRKEMGEYNRCRIEKYFTLDQMIRGYRELFEEVLDCPHKS